MEWLFWTIILSTSLYSLYSLYNVYTSLTLDTEMTRRPAHMIGHLNIINFSIFMFPPKIKLLKQNLSVNSHTPQIFRSNWSFWRGINSDLFSPVTVGLNILSKSAIKWKTYENYFSCFFFSWLSSFALLSAQLEYRALCRSTEELPVRL